MRSPIFPPREELREKVEKMSPEEKRLIKAWLKLIESACFSGKI